jgi:hypothetical protein
LVSRLDRANQAIKRTTTATDASSGQSPIFEKNPPAWRANCEGCELVQLTTAGSNQNPTIATSANSPSQAKIGKRAGFVGRAGI